MVSIISKGNHNYSGVFQGAECAFLRLSLTFDPKKKGVAPGLALKVLRDGLPSTNVSSLYSLDGQGKDYNFFGQREKAVQVMVTALKNSPLCEDYDKIAADMRKIIDEAKAPAKAGK